MRCPVQRLAWPLLLTSALMVGSVPVEAQSSAGSGERPADVPTYRGDAARSGLMPGPGPSADPVIRWTFEPGAPIVSQVAVAAGVVYLVTGVGTLHALDLASGTELWHAESGAPSRAGPSIAGDLVFVANVDGIAAFDLRDGNQVWATTATGGLHGTPAIVGELLVAASADGVVSGVVARSGAFAWQAVIDSPTAASVAADAAIGLAIVGTLDGTAVAVDLADGHVRWRYRTGDAARVGTPTVVDGRAYAATLDGDAVGTRHIHALDAATGRPLWILDSPGDKLAFAPAVADGRAIISGEDGSVTAVDPATGELFWRYDAPAVVETVAAVTDGVVYVASNGGLALALDAGTGNERWRLPIEGVPYGVAVTGGLVLVGTTSGILYAIGSGP